MKSQLAIIKTVSMQVRQESFPVIRTSITLTPTNT